MSSGCRNLIGHRTFQAMPEAADELLQMIAQVMPTQNPFHGAEIAVLLARVAGDPIRGSLD
jgi:hypothetical protein